MEISWLVKHNTIKIDAAHAVVVVGAVETYTSPVGEVHAQLGVICDGAGNGCREALEVCPGDFLRLRVVRRHVGESRLGQLAAKGCVDQIHQTGNGLAGAHMRHDTCPTLRPAMEADE